MQQWAVGALVLVAATAADVVACGTILFPLALPAITAASVLLASASASVVEVERAEAKEEALLLLQVVAVAVSVAEETKEEAVVVMLALEDGATISVFSMTGKVGDGNCRCSCSCLPC